MKLTIKALAGHLQLFSEYLQKVGSGLFQEAFKVQGVKKLSLQQLRYMEVIESSPGITPGDLAKMFAVTKPTVSNIVRQLERSGLIARTRSKDDARVSMLQASETAHAVFEKRRGMYATLARHIETTLDQGQVESLVSLLDAVVKGGLRYG